MVILRHLGRSHVRQLDKKIARRVDIGVGTRVETFTRFSWRWLLKYQDSFILISSVVGGIADCIPKFCKKEISSWAFSGVVNNLRMICFPFA